MGAIQQSSLRTLPAISGSEGWVWNRTSQVFESELANRPGPDISRAMKTSRGTPEPPRMTARERRHRLVGVQVLAASQKGLRVPAKRKPLPVRVGGVLMMEAKGKK